MANARPVVWLLTDNKPGHSNQLKGLGHRLRVLAGAKLYWIDASAARVPLWRALLASPPPLCSEPALPHPDLVIAAGSGTHRLLLSLRRLRRTKTLVLMKPGFPLSWISGAVIPVHDRVQPAPSILVTKGVINAITPMAKITDRQQALILIGGPSPHFAWDNEAIADQVSGLISLYPGWHWTIGSSRRTPKSLQERLDELAGPRITIVHPQQTHENWLSHQLAASRAVWVTPDSMSMVCEAATSGVPAGLLELTGQPGSRVAAGVGQLVKDGHIADRRNHSDVMAGKTGQNGALWEADRAARWVSQQGLLPPAPDAHQSQHRGTRP